MELVDRLTSYLNGSRPRRAVGVHVDDECVRAVVLEHTDAGAALVHRSRWSRHDEETGTGEWDGEWDDAGGVDRTEESAGFERSDETGEFSGTGTSAEDRFAGDDEGVFGVEFDERQSDLQREDEVRDEPGEPLDLDRVFDEEAVRGHGASCGFAISGRAIREERIVLDPGSHSEADLLDEFEIRTGIRPGDREVGILSLTGEPGTAAWVVSRTAEDTVVSTLSRLEEHVLRERPSIDHLYAASTLRVGAARMADARSGGGTSVLVHLGELDTLCAVLEDGRVRQVDRIVSLSALDAPEVVARRLLLALDGVGVEEFRRLYVSAEEGERAFREGLAAQFRRARVQTLSRALRATGYLAESGGSEAVDGSWGAAAASALRVLYDEGDEAFPVNLLPSDLRGRASVVRTQWHTWAAAIALFAIVFVLTPFLIDRHRQLEELRTSAREMRSRHTRASDLRSRIDSLETQTTRFRRALRSTDSLLAGTDRWSRTLERLSLRREGLWLERMETETDSSIVLSGYATSRDRIVRFAERVEASVRLVASEEIRDYPVYRFEVAAPLPGGVPRAIRAFRAERTAAADSLTAWAPRP